MKVKNLLVKEILCDILRLQKSFWTSIPSKLYPFIYSQPRSLEPGPIRTFLAMESELKDQTFAVGWAMGYTTN